MIVREWHLAALSTVVATAANELVANDPLAQITLWTWFMLGVISFLGWGVSSAEKLTRLVRNVETNFKIFHTVCLSVFGTLAGYFMVKLNGGEEMAALLGAMGGAIGGVPMLRVILNVRGERSSRDSQQRDEK